MSGFIEWEFPCPQCKQLTAVLDTGIITEELTCNNDECGYSHSFELTDKGWKELKDINGRYATTTILHNEEISDIYDTLKEQVSKNIKIENTLQEFIKLSPEDQSKVLIKASQLMEVK